MSINFGRYSDAFKPKIQYEKWNECEKLFNEKDYFNSYKTFFDYLKDLESENVFYTHDNEMLKFQFIQGSKEIRGYFDGKKISAISVIAGFEKNNVAVFRRLMELNFTLYYTRFAIKDNKIVIKFDSGVSDCTPNKLYYGLKELATRADKQDDVLLDEFKSLIDIESKSEPYTSEQNSVMIKYFRKWISENLLKVKELNREQYSGGISYILLNLLFKIDYLIMPQGTISNEIDRMSWMYFNNNELNTLQKLDLIEEGLKKLNDSDDSKLEKNIYRTKTTFSLLTPTAKKGIDDVINNNIKNIKWYLDNNHPDIALNILEYIIGYSLYSYGMNKSLRKIYGILMQIINFDYISEIDGSKNYLVNGIPDKVVIIKEFTEAISTDTIEYPTLNMNFDNIQFDNILNFTKTTLEEILKLDYKD